MKFVFIFLFLTLVPFFRMSFVYLLNMKEDSKFRKQVLPYFFSCSWIIYFVNGGKL